MILADPDAVRQMGAISSDIKILPIYSNIQETTVCIDPTILAFQSDAAKFITFIQDCQTLVIDRANSAKQITIYLKAPQLTAAARPIQGGRQIVPKMSGLGIMSMFTQADWNNMFKALLGLCDRMGSKVTSPAVSFRFFRFRQAEFTQIFPLIAPIISYLAIEGHVLDFDGSKLSKCTTIQMLCPPDMNASDDSCTKFWQQLQKVTTCRTIKLRQIKLNAASSAPLSNITDLGFTYLDIAPNDFCTVYTAVGNLSHLTALRLCLTADGITKNTVVPNFNFTCTQLTTCLVAGTVPLVFSNALGYCANLKILRISCVGDQQLHQILLCAATTLTHLSIDGDADLTDLTPLLSFTKLKCLWLKWSSCNRLVTKDFLSQMVQNTSGDIVIRMVGMKDKDDDKGIPLFEEDTDFTVDEMALLLDDEVAENSLAGRVLFIDELFK
jgi:hypothetical protein